MNTPTFEGIPNAIQNNTDQLDRIEKLLHRILSSNKPEQVQYFDIDSLIEYLPGHPAKTNNLRENS